MIIIVLVGLLLPLQENPKGAFIFYTGWDDQGVEVFINDQPVFKGDLHYTPPTPGGENHSKPNLPAMTLLWDSQEDVSENPLLAAIILVQPNKPKIKKNNLIILDHEGRIKVEIILKNSRWRKTFNRKEGLYIFIEKFGSEIKTTQLKKPPAYD